MTDNDLVAEALAARERAYAPYSGIRVGAALQTRDGSIFTGANVENVSYGLTVCAERVAAVKAATAGCREFVAIAVAWDKEGFCRPCGADERKRFLGKLRRAKHERRLDADQVKRLKWVLKMHGLQDAERLYRQLAPDRRKKAKHGE